MNNNYNNTIVVKSNKRRYIIKKIAYSTIKMISKVFTSSNNKNNIGKKKIIYGNSNETYKYEPNCIYVYGYKSNKNNEQNDDEDINYIYNLENDDKSYYENDNNSFENETIN